MEKRLTHLNEKGDARMVDVSDKSITRREAVAEGELLMEPETRRLLFESGGPKGDALAAARIAGIQAAKQTSSLIPLCHPLTIRFVEISIREQETPSAAIVTTTIRVEEKTGAEMEALTAKSVALLTLYDMLKAVEKSMTLSRIRLLRKTGGKSGDFENKTSLKDGD